jgi:hypothetical protein
MISKLAAVAATFVASGTLASTDAEAKCPKKPCSVHSSQYSINAGGLFGDFFSFTSASTDPGVGTGTAINRVTIIGSDGSQVAVKGITLANGSANPGGSSGLATSAIMARGVDSSGHGFATATVNKDVLTVTRDADHARPGRSKRLASSAPVTVTPRQNAM